MSQSKFENCINQALLGGVTRVPKAEKLGDILIDYICLLDGGQFSTVQVRAVFGKDPRQYSVMTKEFLSDDDGNVRGLITVDVEVTKDGIKVSPGESEPGKELHIISYGYLIYKRTQSR